MKTLDCFIPHDITVCEEDGLNFVRVEEPLTATATLRRIAAQVRSEQLLLCTKPVRFAWGQNGWQRMARVASETGAALVYADHYRWRDRERCPHPVVDYQEGSVRDDFDFGALWMVDAALFRQAVAEMDADYRFAGLYDLRLRLSRLGGVERVNEYLYTEEEPDLRKSGEKQFDYVDPRNREAQCEMEQACTAHLKAVGAYLAPQFKEIDLRQGEFPCEATVVIPVRDRVETIADAIDSVLKQQADFVFNLIVVDNHSTDGTTETIHRYTIDPRVCHVVPQRTDLGIGGCWNEAVNHPACGRFVVQLDSDDRYADEHALQDMVHAFYEQQCAMVVGSYRVTDFDGNEIPPGVIDHREWTPDNGRNNALRINGLGAPRAFYTPLLRQWPLPNTSYGEDYAAGLRISREYRLGRVYRVLYLCRRWEGNSDAALDVVRQNANNVYKDRLRSWELKARKAINHV